MTNAAKAPFSNVPQETCCTLLTPGFVPTRLSHLMAGSPVGQPEIEKLIAGPVGFVVGETIDVGLSPEPASVVGVPLFAGAGKREQELNSSSAMLHSKAPTPVFDRLKCKYRRWRASLVPFPRESRDRTFIASTSRSLQKNLIVYFNVLL